MKIGLLPLYIKLYDDGSPQLRPRLQAFYEDIAAAFERRDVSVVRSPFCRLTEEFNTAVKLFEVEQVDAIVTLHMAYSPSLESIEALSGTELPIVVLDTTSTLVFTNMQDSGEISYCHGIHGVMDMCNMLARKGKAFAIAAGHYAESDCMDRVCGFVKAAMAAKALKKTRVGLIGGAFHGMGDFQATREDMKEKFGITVLDMAKEEMAAYVQAVSDEEIAAELAKDKARFEFADNVIPEEYLESVRSCLAVRRCIEDKKLTAFSSNFLKMGEPSGLPVMPFMEACKAMERGVGYAGEGDVLTASFVGAFLQTYPNTNFVEIFCPDWKNNMVFLSHMGETNYRIADTKPVVTRAGKNYVEGPYPYVGYTRMQGGEGVYLNICPTKEGFRFVAVAARIKSYDQDTFPTSMRGWMETDMSTAELLEGLSRNGATHHSVFVYGATVEQIRFFGDLLNVETVVL